MSAPRPDTNEVIDLVEDETNLNWNASIDEPDYIRLVTEVWMFDIVWNGDYWTLELYDLADSQYGEDEPKWAQGPMRNATEILKEIPGFIPNEVRA